MKRQHHIRIHAQLIPKPLKITYQQLRIQTEIRNEKL